MLVFYGIPQSEERFGCIHCLGGCKACRNWKPAVAIGSIVKAIREGTKSGDEFRELIIDHGMQRFVNSSSPTTRGKHILRVAIEYARLSYVKILVGLGANVNSEDVHGRVVNAACSSIEPESVAIITFLLMEGAVVDDATKERYLDMWTSYATTKAYLIQRAQHCFSFKPDRVKALGVAGVSALTLGVVGQPLALTWLLRAIFGQLRRQLDKENKKPLVLVFGGKPGHGKTQTAELLSKLKLAGSGPSNFIKINCNTSRHMGDFLGHASTYVGSEKDTALNKFLLEQDGRTGVVLLDEADKLDEGCWIALMSIFERGIIRPYFESCFSLDLGGAITRRIDGFIPFLTFSKLERFVLAELAFSNETSSFKILLPEYPVSDIALSCTTGAMVTLGERYKPSGGATCIQVAVNRCLEEVPAMYAQGQIDPSTDPNNPTKIYVSRVKVDGCHRILTTKDPPAPEDPVVEPPSMDSSPADDDSKEITVVARNDPSFVINDSELEESQ